jgi:hypothetical protein
LEDHGSSLAWEQIVKSYMKDNLKQKELGHASSGKALCKQALGPDPQDPELKKKNTKKKLCMFVSVCGACVQ